MTLSIPGYRRDDLSQDERIALGQYPGVFSRVLQGHRVGLTLNAKETVWHGNAVYTWTTTSPIDTISSSNAAEDCTVSIFGVDWTTRRFTEFTVTLNGQNKVGIPDLWRVNSVFVIAPTTGTNNIAGELYVYEDTAIVAGVPTDTTKIKSVVDTGEAVAESAIFSMDNYHQGSLCVYLASQTKANNFVLVEAVARVGGVHIGGLRFNIKENPFDIKPDCQQFLLPPGADYYLTATAAGTGSDIYALNAIKCIEV
jgi:hypothetical protein